MQVKEPGVMAGERPEVPASGGQTVDGGSGRTWPRALGLLVAVVSLTVVSPSALIGVPLVLLVLALPTRSTGLMLVGAFAAYLAFQGVSRDGLWYAERGWAILVGGWFVALTLRWPALRFTGRALGAVAGGMAAGAAVLAVGGGRWSVLDWMMAQRIRSEIMTGVALLRSGEEPLAENLVEGVYGMMEGQIMVFPAALALASMAGLGVAWWLHSSLSEGDEEGPGPLRRFGFDDQWIWLLIVGLGLVVLGGEGVWERAGWNAVVFMGALYALRGVAVALFLMGGISLPWAAVFVVGLLFLWPVVAVSAAVVGLGDTWLKIREKVERTRGTTV